MLTLFKGSCKVSAIYTSNLWKKIIGVVAFILQYALPVFCFTGCYVCIVNKLATSVSTALLHYSVHLLIYNNALIILCDIII